MIERGLRVGSVVVAVVIAVVVVQLVSNRYTGGRMRKNSVWSKSIPMPLRVEVSSN